MIKRLLLLTVLAFSLQLSAAFSQISIGTVDAGPYGVGSNITVPISFANNLSEFPADNTFTLYLSDENGNFAGNGTQIGTYNGFYTQFINGTLPSLAPGTGYRLRVVATSPTIPSQTIDVPGAITITNTTVSGVTLTPNFPSNSKGTDILGWCPSESSGNKSITLRSNAVAPTVATLQVTSSSGTTTNYNETASGFQLTNISIGNYTLIITATTVVNGQTVKSVRSYLLHNAPLTINIQDIGENVGCISAEGQGARISYEITLPGGIANNYPGTVYRINWGDGQTENLTLQQIANNSSRISHLYMRTSCGQPAIPGPPDILNSFKATITANSTVCGENNSATAYAQIFLNPIARFTPENSKACVNRLVRFNNESIGGTRSDCSTQMDYTWFVDGVNVKESGTNDPLDWTFTTTGIHTIRLIASNGLGVCTPSEFTSTICISNPPQPAFDFGNASTRGCAPFQITAVDRSVIDRNCDPDATYNWIVTPMAGVTFTNGITDPTFTFTTPGVYEVSLQITTASCGAEITMPPQTIIIIDGQPTATLSDPANLCDISLPFEFNNVTTGPTRTTFSGTVVSVADTYTWTVTNIDGSALAPSEFSFINSAPNSQYPNIKFNNYKTYRISVTHKNSCGTTTDTQDITFTESPVAAITATPNPICYNGTVQLNGNITNSNGTTYTWSSTNGGTFSNPNSLTPVFTPSQQERDNGSTTITLTVNTGLQGACAVVSDTELINIYPNNTGTNAVQEICTGTAASHTPGSTIANSTFSWVATNPDGNASGYSSGSGTSIQQTLTNTSATTNAIVIYTITPASNGCAGVPYTFTVTVAPRPVGNGTPLEAIICSNQQTQIQLSSNLINTTFSWTSIASPGIQGNTNGSTTIVSPSTINDLLTNTSFLPGTVTYTITPISAGRCPGQSFNVTITVEPPVTTANAGPDENICDDDSYQLQGNAVINVGSGTWTLESSTTTDPIIITTPANPQSTVTGLSPGNTYTFRWTISSSGVCQQSSDLVTITVNEPTIAGTLDGAATVCQGTNGGQLTLSGSRGTIIRWESSIDGGTTWVEIQNTTTSYSYTNLAQTTQYRVIVQNGTCDQRTSNIIVVTVTPAGTIADAGPAQILCAPTAIAPVSTILTGNSPSPATETGLWTVTPANPSIVIENPAGPTTRVNGLMPGQSYTFTWTISGTSACGPNFSTVTVQILLPIENNTITSSSAIVCSGRLIDIIGSTVTGGTGNYSYNWERSLDNGTTWTSIPNETSKDLLNYQVVETTTFRRSVNSASCSLFSNEYTVTAQPPVANNTITADQTICSGLSPAELTGSLPSGGDGIFRYQWQSSTDGSTWTNIPGALGQNYQPPILTTLTQYRRIVTTAACDGVLQNVSNVVIITVNPNAEAEFTYAFQTGCAPFALSITATPYPDRNATYTWYANNNVIGTGIDFPGYTITESNTTATIRLVVTSSLGCSSDEQSTVFSTNQAVPASFSQSTSSGCGPLAVNFVNTSVLTGGATFVWDFGNGQTSTQANPPTVTYLPEPTGKDTTYVVTLTATTSCGADVRTSTVLVKAQPIAVFSPSRTDGCSPMTVNFTNTSPGSTNTYFYDFGDGSPILETTDKGPVQHIYTTTTVQLFRARLTVVNECGTDFREYNIRVAPQNITPELVVDATQKEGCAPLLVNFDNNSTGATRFTFDFGDGGTLNTVAPGRVQHTYTRPGTYTVTMTAYNSCSEIATTETITVLPQPVAAFEADVTLGCPGLPVQFRNTTQDGFSYLWDFGDGTTSDEFEPRHIYSGDQEYYTVTLTATNTLGCSISLIRNQYIHVVQPPVARFNVDPSVVIDIPNYTFRFIDESTGTPTNWAWDFGDGTSSSSQSPSHTYPDTGTYRVTLRVMNQQGCFTTTFKDVTIKGVPGYLFVPNSFIPGSQMPELREFKAKGSGMETYKLSIFNKWGELLWETTKLEEGRPAEGWDGTFKGSPMPQGVYFWKMEVKMINGTEWKGMTYDSSPPRRTGPIHLIR